MKKAIIFDLDGTLWDASESVTDAFNIALEGMGISKRITKEEMMNQMGKTLDDIAHTFFDDVDKDKAVDIMVRCTEYENEYIKTHGGKLYPGVLDALCELKRRNWFIACVSNCQSGYIEAFENCCGLENMFDDIECWGNTGRLKADNIRSVVDRNRIDRAIYVGDTMGDFASAKEAGTAFVHSAYGYGAVPKGTPTVRDLSELFSVLESLDR